MIDAYESHMVIHKNPYSRMASFKYTLVSTAPGLQLNEACDALKWVTDRCRSNCWLGGRTREDGRERE